MSLEARLRRRPLSPHLAIYRPTMTMMMSIVHRLTATAPYFGTLLLTLWLIAAVEGQVSYQLFESWICSAAAKLILLCHTWSLIHHLMSGLRHFACDIGQGFDLATTNLMPPATLIGSLILTVLSHIRGLGSAKGCTRYFWIQRLSAAANVPLALFLIASLIARSSR